MVSHMNHRSVKRRPEVQTRTLFFLLLIWLTRSGCSKERRQPASQQALDTRSAKPDFQLSPDKLRSLRDNVTALKIGTRREAVVSLLGNASREDLMAPKRDLDWKCRILVYQVTRVDKSAGNVHDREVQLVFQRQSDQLVQIISTVDRTQSRGDMATCK